MGKKKALGRGLDALITMESNETQGSSFISEVEIEKIKPNPDQPRTNFDDETIKQLEDFERIAKFLVGQR